MADFGGAKWWIKRLKELIAQQERVRALSSIHLTDKPGDHAGESVLELSLTGMAYPEPGSDTYSEGIFGLDLEGHDRHRPEAPRPACSPWRRDGLP